MPRSRTSNPRTVVRALPRRVRLGLLLLLAWVLLPTGTRALAQSSEFKLDPGGNWVQTKAPAPGTDEGTLAEARRDLAEGRFDSARRTAADFIEKNDRSNSPLLPEALVIRGDALTADNDEYNALYDYERVIKEFPATPSFVTSLERELDIAVRYVNGLRSKFFGVRVFDASGIGEELLIRIQERLPGSRLAERAGIELADHFYRQRDLELAGEAYDLFQQNYPQSQYYMSAAQRRVYATIGRFKGPRYDGSVLLDAKVLTERFSSLYPAQAQQNGLDDALLVRLDESAADAALETAEWYLSRGDEVSARMVFRRLVKAHPQSAAAERALKVLDEHKWPLDAPALLQPPAPKQPVPAKATTGKSPPPTKPPAPKPPTPTSGEDSK